MRPPTSDSPQSRGPSSLAVVDAEHCEVRLRSGQEYNILSQSHRWRDPSSSNNRGMWYEPCCHLGGNGLHHYPRPQTSCIIGERNSCGCRGAGTPLCNADVAGGLRRRWPEPGGNISQVRALCTDPGHVSGHDGYAGGPELRPPAGAGRGTVGEQGPRCRAGRAGRAGHGGGAGLRRSAGGAGRCQRLDADPGREPAGRADRLQGFQALRGSRAKPLGDESRWLRVAGAASR